MPASQTFAQLDVQSSTTPLVRYDASGATTAFSQWTSGVKTTSLVGKYVVCADDTLATPMMTLDGSGNLTVNGTFSAGGGINVSLSNPMISGLITSVGSDNMTVNDADLNMAAQYGRKVDGTTLITDNYDATYTIALDTSIDGNNALAYASGDYINIQNPVLGASGGPSPFDNQVYQVTAIGVSGSSITIMT